MKQIEVFYNQVRWWDSSMTPGAEITVYIRNIGPTSESKHCRYGSFLCKDVSDSDNLLTIFRKAITRKQVSWMWFQTQYWKWAGVDRPL